MPSRIKWLLGMAVFVALAAGGWLVSPAEEQQPKGENKVNNDVRVFMRMKLDASSKILEGLTTEDFRLVRDGAKTLRQMSSAEKWRVSNDPLYRQYSLEFTRHAEKLDEQGNARNLDGATLAWVECTMSCIRCHSHARAIKIAKE